MILVILALIFAFCGHLKVALILALLAWWLKEKDSDDNTTYRGPH
jgi:hypothetical protein